MTNSNINQFVRTNETPYNGCSGIKANQGPKHSQMPKFFKHHLSYILWFILLIYSRVVEQVQIHPSFSSSV